MTCFLTGQLPGVSTEILFMAEANTPPSQQCFYLFKRFSLTSPDFFFFRLTGFSLTGVLYDLSV